MNVYLLQMRRVLRAAFFFSCLPALTSVSNSVVADDAATVQPFIGETTILILKVDPARLSLPELSGTLKSAFPAGKDAYDQWALDVGKGIERLQEAAGGQPVYATIGIPLSKNEWPAFLFVKETSEQNREKLTDLLGSLDEVQSFTRSGLTVVAPSRRNKAAFHAHPPFVRSGLTVVAAGRNVDVESSLNSMVPSPRVELAAAFEAVREYPIQVLLLPPSYVRRTITELMPQLPRHLGGGPSGLLTDGLMWAALGIDLSATRTELVIQSASEQAARDLADHLPKMLLAAYDEFPAVEKGISREGLEALLALVKPQVVGDRITIRLDELQSIDEVVRLVASVPAAASEQMRRRTNIDSFKQIMLAMHNHHDVYQSFPPRAEVRDADGNSGLSWRVHVLPFLDESKLYAEFALDQPWDSPHNKPLIEKMPKVYESQWLGITPGHTTFLAPVGEDTIFGGHKAIKFQNITDGTSNTATLVEVKPSLSVPWTAPRDYAFEPEDPGKGLRVGPDGRFLAALADGSVNMFRGNAAAELLLRLFRKSDGNPLSWSELR
ncbi:MAG TPA: DUF1559 domain-containing protein [Pirellulaceae bacterium]|nr:DUF1559 domain-containing protein [Pirellulaceae bacterium]